MNKLTIIYRYCDKEIPASGIARSQIFGNKEQTWLQCAASTFEQINSFRINKHKDIELELHIVEDPVKNLKIRNEMTSLLSLISINPNTTIQTHKLNKSGNAASIGACLDIAYNSDTDAIFFIEDDYIFDTNALSKMVRAYDELSNNIQRPVCIHPVDYIDRYTRAVEPCHVLLSSDHHWRTILHTTGTVMMPKIALRDNWNNITKFRNYQLLPGCGEDETINTTYKIYPCFSPIPTLAHHIQYQELLSPFYDLNFNRVNRL